MKPIFLEQKIGSDSDSAQEGEPISKNLNSDKRLINVKIPVYEIVSFWPSTFMVSTGLQFIANFRCIQEIPWASRNSERPFTSTCFHVPSNFERFSLNICLAYLLRFIMKKIDSVLFATPYINLNTFWNSFFVSITIRSNNHNFRFQKYFSQMVKNRIISLILFFLWNET